MLDEATIKKLRDEKAFLEGVMKNGRAQIKAIDAVLKSYETVPSTNGRSPRKQAVQPTVETLRGNTKSLREEIRDVLAIRQPLALKDIRASLDAKEVVFTDTNLSYTLSQSHLFENANGKWSLTEFGDE